MPGKTILLVDDEKKVLFLLSDALEEQGFRVKSTTFPAQALKTVRENPIDAVVLDLVMPGSGGIEILQAIKKEKPGLPVIMLSGHGTIGKAVEAVKLGAYDFLEKPVSSDKIAVTLKNALRQSGLEQDKTALLEKVAGEFPIIGQSEAVGRITREIGKMAPTDLPVLISGESGTGKELIARALHVNSLRAAGPFVPLNCSALPDNLVESELFGYKKGAFSDAYKDKPGLFEQAHGGTLFLDEIGEMSLGFQSKLLRVLESMEFMPLGAASQRKVDVRVISATNMDLKQAVKEKKFREDLFYRAAVLTIQAPPLRERREDIPLLAEHFVSDFCRARKRSPLRIDPHAMELMMEFSWPGNVRQLKNLLEKVVVMTEGDRILYEEMETHLAPGVESGGGHSAVPGGTLEQARKKAEKEKILTKLHILDWDYREAARELGIPRSTFFYKLKEHGISKRPR